MFPREEVPAGLRLVQPPHAASAEVFHTLSSAQRVEWPTKGGAKLLVSHRRNGQTGATHWHARVIRPDGVEGDWRPLDPAIPVGDYVRAEADAFVLFEEIVGEVQVAEWRNARAQRAHGETFEQYTKRWPGEARARLR